MLIYTLHVFDTLVIGMASFNFPNYCIVTGTGKPIIFLFAGFTVL
jgi:hypothetical protein